MQLHKKIALTAIAAAAVYRAPRRASRSKVGRRRARPARIAGQPNINGVWQAMNTRELEPRGAFGAKLGRVLGARLARRRSRRARASSTATARSRI